MRDYERYMDCQRLSETGMARLRKLETERPKKRRRPVPQGVKYMGMAACLFLVVGLFAAPIVREAWQQAKPAEEELYFHEVESVPFTDQAIAGGIGMRPMEPEEAAAIFGSSPDDFVGLLETVGLSKFDMEYYAFDYYPLGVVPQGDSSYRFLMKGCYVSPTIEEKLLPTTSFVPVSTVWLEVYEGHSYRGETDWSALEPHAFHGHQVAAARDANNYRAAAAFDVESGGKTYGVLYAVTADGEGNATELVTRMVDYITRNGLTISNNELVFNQVDVVPSSMDDLVIGERNTEMIAGEIGMILHSSEEHFLTDMGWEGFQVSGCSEAWGKDPETGYSVNRFAIRGKDGNDGSFELELRPNTRFYEEEWTGLETCEVNGHTVTAVSGFDTVSRLYRAAAAFEVEDIICTYGVYYRVSAGDEATAREMVTELVEKLTSGGVFTEMYREFGGLVLDYEELPQVGTERQGMTVGASRPLSREEIEWAFPVIAEDSGAWSGHAYFYPDGTVGSIVLSGFTNYGGVSDETAVRHVTIVMGKEEETFRDNYVKGRYIGAETEGPWGNQLRGYWWHDPDFIWGSDENDVAADRFVCQIQDPGQGWVAEIATCQKGGTLEEGRWLNIDWVNRAMGNLWWKEDLTMESDSPVTAAVKTTGRYVMETDVEPPVEGMLWTPVVSFQGDGSCGVFVDYVSSHMCRSRYQVAGGRVTTDCEQHHYVFDIVDENTLRFVGAQSSEPEHYGTSLPKITDGAVFRWTEEQDKAAAPKLEPSGVFYFEQADGYYPYLNLNADGNTFRWQRGEDSSRSGSYAVKDGVVRCYQGGQTYVFEAVDESTLWFVGASSDSLDYLDTDRATRTLPDGAVLCRDDARLGALDAALGDQKAQLESDIVSTKTDGSTWVWGDGTHHPEPEHHVEPTHHVETHHSGHH